MKTETKIVVVDSKLAEQIEIIRFGEDHNGFQRKLSNDRVAKMAAALSNGTVCPPILLGDLRGRLIMLDGQHRFEAWKKSIGAFTLEAKIISLIDMNQAKKLFVDLNSYQKRVGLKLRLSVDPSEYAYRLRSIAKKYQISVTDAQSLMIGILGTWKFYVDSAAAITNSQWELADRILSCWSKDKRWLKGVNVYSRPGVLRVVADIAVRSRNIEGTLNEIKGLDFSIGSKIARLYGGSSTSQKIMKQIIHEYIAKKTLALAQ